MDFNNIITDLGLQGSSTHKTYDAMIAGWYAHLPNNPPPSLELCIETWNNVTLPRLTGRYKQERIQEVKLIANQLLQETDWKITKQLESENTAYSEMQWAAIVSARQAIRDKSDKIEQEILALDTWDAVEQYIIQF